MKKRCVCLVFVCFAPICLQAQRIDLDYLRLNYETAVFDKKLCNSIIEKLKDEKDNPIYLNYLGGLQTIWANHTINPISKLLNFNKGKNNLDKAVEMASDNVEIRFIRLSIQENAPTFLGYHQQIKEDKDFIKKHKQTITAASLLRLMNKPERKP